MYTMINAGLFISCFFCIMGIIVLNVCHQPIRRRDHELVFSAWVGKLSVPHRVFYISTLVTCQYIKALCTSLTERKTTAGLA
ncbi:hypothetical protein B0H34DRAFT_206286 [Crassisporium funariophilum]|nr:hypothetical protein B0H34DRAFT_206286 [Crassisporium funariophilum]